VVPYVGWQAGVGCYAGVGWQAGLGWQAGVGWQAVVGWQAGVGWLDVVVDFCLSADLHYAGWLVEQADTVVVCSWL